MAKNRIYLDYASTTPLDKRIFRVMLPFFEKEFGNSMSLHSFGQKAKVALEESREKIASMISAEPEEIIFTGSATESNNLALKGFAFKNKEKGNHILISSIEHPCVVESAEWLKTQGFEITLLPVNKFGFVDLNILKQSIKKETILVSIIHASNEVGTIQPIEEIGKICEEKGVAFHTDASQSFGKIPIDVKKNKISMLTASSHKIYGPKGVAFLFLKKGIKIEPILHGGGQESGLRSSTVNIPVIVGFAEAAEISKKEMEKEGKRISKLRDELIAGVLKKIKGSRLNGHPTMRLQNNANFSFSGVEGESIVISLDLEGIACSTGSACSSAKLEPSHILMALGLPIEDAHGSLRVSLGRWTKKEDIRKFLKVLPVIIERLRRISVFK